MKKEGCALRTVERHFKRCKMKSLTAIGKTSLYKQDALEAVALWYDDLWEKIVSTPPKAEVAEIVIYESFPPQDENKLSLAVGYVYKRGKEKHLLRFKIIYLE